MVTIATLNEQGKAKQLKQQFQQAGVKADIVNEGHLQKTVFMSKPQANVKIMIEEEDFGRAQQLMTEWEANDPDIAASILRCPQCSSTRIEYPQMTRKFFLPALTSVLLAMKMFPKEFYCEVCHFTWTNEVDQSRYRFWHWLFPAGDADKAS